ncbi:MAG: WGR domain-containing protein [Myxococcota bacterium]|nr:WGR domain-containing protein [Myxococcota bacterium]
MPRYEFSQGTSNKFWEIELASKSFTTTYGKIGAGGQTTIKQFASDAEARKEHDKVVAEKVKKGYVLVGGGAKAPPVKGAKPTTTADAAPAIGKRDARNPALEAAIAADPSDREAYAVFGDWLQEQGDPRGELISLQLAYKDKQGKALIEKHADYFLGPLAEHVKVYDSGANNSVSKLRTPAQEKEWQKTHEDAFLWRNGFIYRVRLSHDVYSHEDFKGELSTILEQVLAHPSGRYVAELAFMSNGDPNEDDLQDLIDVLARRAPATTRKLVFGDNVDQISWHHTGDLGKLWKAVPKLRVLELETGQFEVRKLHAPALERAIFITGGLSRSCGKDIATAVMPAIQHLEIYYGSSNYGGECTMQEVRPLLDRTDLGNLAYLGLKNSEFADELATNLLGAKVLKGLKTLDLSHGVLTDEGARALVAAKESLAHLECLDLSQNYLSKAGSKLVKGLCKTVITDKQKAADEDGEDVYRYVSVAE